MHLTSEERRALQSHEDAREREACGEGPEVTCCECEEALDEDRAHTVQGETCCAMCAVDRIITLRRDAPSWRQLSAAQRLEIWEVLGAAAGEMESALRAAIRAGKAA